MSGHKVSGDELARFIREILVAQGAFESDAAEVAEGLVWANLRGVDGHGVSRLPRYIGFIKRGDFDMKARPRLGHDRAATFMLESGHGFGPVACMKAAALAVERAKQYGVCFGIVRESTHTGAIGRYAQWIAQHDCAAIIMGAGQTLMAYHGTRRASLGTSPIAMAVPTGNGPIVLDMATSMISNGKILQARVSGEALPEGTVLTKDGDPTTDAKAAETLLPLGGAKGSGLSLMFEMFGSILSAAPIQARAIGPEQRTRNTANTTMIAVDIAAFRPMGAFVDDADTLVTLLKALPRQAGFNEILMPGERSGRTEAQRRKSGIPIGPKLWQELETIAAPHKIAMPAAVS
ncbi:MAG TPA: Ldh family oxidoreductase [Xanthobacteraceae bacterium]|nr:Ldh family oxidoreductase [Xanthobacteraceae bacterium]